MQGEPGAYPSHHDHVIDNGDYEDEGQEETPLYSLPCFAKSGALTCVMTSLVFCVLALATGGSLLWLAGTDVVLRLDPDPQSTNPDALYLKQVKIYLERMEVKVCTAANHTLACLYDQEPYDYSFSFGEWIDGPDVEDTFLRDGVRERIAGALSIRECRTSSEVTRVLISVSIVFLSISTYLMFAGSAPLNRPFFASTSTLVAVVLLLSTILSWALSARAQGITEVWTGCYAAVFACVLATFGMMLNAPIGAAARNRHRNFLEMT